MTDPAVGGGAALLCCGGVETLPAGVLIRGGCTLERGERGERGEHQGLEIMVLSLPVVPSRPLHSAPTTVLDSSQCSVLTTRVCETFQGKLTS